MKRATMRQGPSYICSGTICEICMGIWVHALHGRPTMNGGLWRTQVMEVRPSIFQQFGPLLYRTHSRQNYIFICCLLLHLGIRRCVESCVPGSFSASLKCLPIGCCAWPFFVCWGFKGYHRGPRRSQQPCSFAVELIGVWFMYLYVSRQDSHLFSLAQDDQIAGALRHLVALIPAQAGMSCSFHANHVMIIPCMHACV